MASGFRQSLPERRFSVELTFLANQDKKSNMRRYPMQTHGQKNIGCNHEHRTAKPTAGSKKRRQNRRDVRT
jgi:hypothetical protein